MMADLVGGWLGALLGVALLVYWIAVVLIIIFQNRPPTTSLAWILVLVLFPGFGLVLYIFAGRDWKTITTKRAWYRTVLKIQRPYMDSFYERYADFSREQLSHREKTMAARLIRAIEIQNFGAPPLPANDLAIYPSGEEYFPILIDDISRAQRFVHMQYFIWGHDELTEKICEVLLERLHAGVEVRILNDFLGCIKYRKDQLKKLKLAGAKVGYDVSQLGKLNYRNHRKITVVDGLIGHTGGVNIAQEYIDGGDRFPSWRDTGMRFTGPAVGELQKLFSYRWFEVFHESLFDDRYFQPEDAPVAENPLTLQVVAQGVDDPWNSSTRTFEIAISDATERVWLQSPYWVPTEGILHSVMNAALSGLDVRLMMTGWPDKKIAFQTAETYWEPLLRAGGKVYLYDAGFFHAKSITLDGQCSAVGTMNLDVRSLELHQELMVWCYDPVVAVRQEEIFLADLESCHEVTLDDIASVSALARFRNSASRLASNLL